MLIKELMRKTDLTEINQLLWYTKMKNGLIMAGSLVLIEGSGKRKITVRIWKQEVGKNCLRVTTLAGSITVASY